MLCAVRLDVIRGCSITYCYSSRCSAETAKINLANGFCSCCVLRSGAEIRCFSAVYDYVEKTDQGTIRIRMITELKFGVGTQIFLFRSQ